MKIMSRHKLALLLLALGLGACAKAPTYDDSRHLEQQLSTGHPELQLTAEDRAATIKELLQQPLSPQTATQLMLLNSPRIQIFLAQMGIANAHRAQAELFRNPYFAVGALRPEGGGRWQLDLGLSQSLLDVFTRSLRRDLAETALLQTRLQLHREIQNLIAELNNAYFAAVATQQILELHAEKNAAAAASQALAESMSDAGNLAESKLLHYQLSAQQEKQHHHRSQLHAESALLELNYLLGLRPDITLHLPSELQRLPGEKFSANDLVDDAKDHRVDLQLIQQQQQYLAQQRPVVTRSRWADAKVGVNVEREFDGAMNIGPEIEFGLPLFDRGDQKLALLDAQLTASKARQTDLLLKIERDIALALRQLTHARAMAEQSKAAQQTAKQRSGKLQREVNFMLTSPFDLLQFKQQEIAVGIEHIAALKEYWQARASLELIIGKPLPSADKLVEPDHTTPSSNIDHSKHHHEGHHHD